MSDEPTGSVDEHDPSEHDGGGGDGDGGSGAPSHSRVRMVVVIVVIVLIALGGIATLMIYGGEKPTSTSDQDALDRFREDGEAGTTATSSVQGGLVPPKPGVYTYTGRGQEVTSFPPLTEQQGPDMPATVVVGENGCWTFRIDYNTHHWQDFDFCSTDSGLTNSGGETFARRDFVTVQIDNTSIFTCDPPQSFLWQDMQPGDVREGSCTGTSSVLEGLATESGPLTYIGREDIEVAGTTMAAEHIRLEHVIGGVQSGSQTADWWFHPETGLPLRNEHSIIVHTGTPIGNIDYTEDASFEIVSLDPRT